MTGEERQARKAWAGGIWSVILRINGAVQAIGLALLVLFFLMGVVKTGASLSEIKRPEHAGPEGYELRP